VDEIAEIDKEVRDLRARILELNKRRIALKKLAKTNAAQRAAPLDLSHLYNIPIRATNLRTYAVNELKRNNIETIGDLTQKTREEVRKIRNLGEGSFTDIEAMMLTLGVSFKGDE
jgi:DNA-directed RNA polymerase alpha subunit